MPSARQINWARVRVFMVAVAGLSILAVLIYLLSGSALFEERSTLYAYGPDATGLSPGSSVRVNGIDVGKIQDVSLSGSNQPDRAVRLTLRIDQQYIADIPADSYAQIENDTAVGDKYISIARGRSAAYIRPNGEVAFRAQPDLMKTLDLEQFTQQLRTMDALLDRIEQGKDPTSQLLFSDQLYNQVRAEIAGFEREIRDIEKPENPVGKWLYTDQSYRQIHDRVLALDQTLAAIQASETPLGKFLRDDTQYNQFTTQLGELRHSLEGLKQNAFLQSDEAYTQWSRQLSSLIETVDQMNVNPLLTTSEMYDNLTGLAAELRNNIREFREDPQKFLRIKLF
jgi:phospholipid/cholesterol/gamma-HCH transport system substrate-binding protein